LCERELSIHQRSRPKHIANQVIPWLLHEGAP
jgi:hypothetical protein